MALMAYLTLEGSSQGAMDGSCEQKSREKTIEVFAIEHNIMIPKDPQTGQPTGSRQHQPFCITKPLDKASPKIMQAVASGEQMSKFELKYFRINDKGQEEHYYTVKLEKAIVVTRNVAKKNIKLDEYKNLTDLETVSFTYEKIVETFEKDGIEGEDNWKEPKA
ncbi:MAG: hypothetical protein RL154_986 [Pseudomonadota bacterium]|jgi:type VI secretion system secreted protein Hcp